MPRVLPAHGQIPVAEVGRCRPTSLAGLAGIVGHAVGHVEYLCKDHLRHTVGAVGRHVAHGDAQVAGRQGVDGVVSRGQYAYQPQVGQLLKRLPRECHLVGYYDFCIMRTLDYL